MFIILFNMTFKHNFYIRLFQGLNKANRKNLFTEKKKQKEREVQSIIIINLVIVIIMNWF